MAGAALCVWGCERGNASLTECLACKRLFHHCCAAQHGQEDSNLCGAWTSGPGCRVGATGEPCAPQPPPSQQPSARKSPAPEVIDVDAPAPKRSYRPNQLAVMWAAGAPPSAAVNAALAALPSAAATSALERSRVVSSNSPSASTGRDDKPAKGSNHFGSREMSAARLVDFPDQSFVINVNDRRQLRCKACNATVNSKKSIVLIHTQSKGHIDALAKYREREQPDQVEEMALAAAAAEGMAVVTARRVDDQTRTFRKDTVKTFLANGTALNKINGFRSYLERWVPLNLTTVSHLNEFIPILELEEMQRNKNWLADSDVGGVFDGASRLGEMEAIVARKVTDDLHIETRLISVKLYAQPLDGSMLARSVIEALSTGYQIKFDAVISLCRDRAAVNGVAMRELKRLLYANLTDLECISHTLDHVGTQLAHKELTSFFSILTRMWSQSDNSRILFKRFFGFTPDTESDTRWWSWFMTMRSLTPIWHRLEEYLLALEADGLAEKSVKAALLLLRGGHVTVPAHGIVPASTRNEPRQAELIAFQAAVVVEFAEPIMRLGYFAEGDGPVVLYVYEKLLAIEEHIRNPHLPNADAKAEALKRNNAAMDVTAVRTAITKPACEYFRAKFGRIREAEGGALSSNIALYKLARMLDPLQMSVMDVEPEQLDAWSDCFAGVKKYPALIPGLKSELAAYKAACAELPKDVDILRWWRLQRAKLPSWVKLLRLVLLLSPSSAAVERVFSIMRRTFHEQQDAALADMIRTSLMLQYNSRGDERLEDRRSVL